MLNSIFDVLISNNFNNCQLTKQSEVQIKLKMSAKKIKNNYQKFGVLWSRNFIIAGLMLFMLLGNDIVEGALRNVNLIIEPPAVRRGQHAILRCLYNLEGAPLYSAKFYRGQLEFYRYTPGEFPNTKVFPFPGIHVDVTSSNATQVLIRNVGFGLSGNFSCEVTADAPLFSTAYAAAMMQVVELPDKRPQLFTEHTRYEPGDILRANCSTLPSRPRAELKFTINNMMLEISKQEKRFKEYNSVLF
ncbi:uncharacterized protein LOC119676231 [Teleopsis dalmanni]|uniref:uncharacterized protein LOC119676231 n=1 Tax=Teleopsis dalmanni TaxID=139649 RepID=UPI0018CF4F82|nr:uncharacterized protein LOC119676231 [Teleopsis dalmanni]